MFLKRLNLFFIALLTIFTVATYLNSHKNSFVWDDYFFIVENPHIRSLSNWPGFLTEKKTFSSDGRFQIYRPLRNVSFAIDYYFSKLDTIVYHISNTILHTLCSILVYYLISCFFKFHFTFNKEDSQHLVIPLLSFLAAVIFALHPIHTETVTWIKGRDDLLVTLFFIASLIAYMKFRSLPNAGCFRFYRLSLLMFVPALFSKEMAITLPAVIVIYDLYFKLSFKELFHKKNIKIYAPFAILSIIYFIFRTQVVGSISQTSFIGGTPFNTFLIMTKGMAYYFRLLLMPVNLNIDYMKFNISGLFDPTLLVSGVVIILIIYLVKKCFKDEKLISFSISFFFITILPVSGIIPIKITIAERFLYLPSISFSIIIAVLVYRVYVLMSKRYRLSSTIIVLSVIFIPVFFSFLTIKRNTVWKDEISIWKDTAKKDKRNDRAYHNLGVAYIGEEKYEKAHINLSKALELRKIYNSPSSFISATAFNLGVAYYNLKEYANAEKYIDYAINLGGGDEEGHAHLFHFQRGLIYKKTGRYELAHKEYKRSIEIHNRFSEAFGNKGNLYMEQGKLSHAMRYFNIAVRLDPYYFEAKYNLGSLFMRQNNFKSSIKWLKEASLIEHKKDYFANYGLAQSYASLGKFDKAIDEFKKTLEKKDDFIDAYIGLANIYEHVKSDSKNAIVYLEKLKEYILNENELKNINDRVQNIKLQASSLKYVK